MAEKTPPTVEHQEPPIYYCWTFWDENGKAHEGCTPIQPPNHSSWPDLNDYGWVYIAIPIALVFVIIFVVYLICSKTGSSKPAQKKSLILEESDYSDAEIEPVRNSKWSPVRSYRGNGAVHAVPIRKSKARDYYTVVHLPDNNDFPARKVPPRGGVAAPLQPGLYPSAPGRQQSYPREMYVKTPPGQPISPLTNYHGNGPVQPSRPKKPSPDVAVELSSSSENVVTESEESEDENAV